MTTAPFVILSEKTRQQPDPFNAKDLAPTAAPRDSREVRPRSTMLFSPLPLLALAATAFTLSPAQAQPQSSALSPQSSAKPNIVLILADDLGVGELGCYGQTKIRTPNIDALAKDGIRFTTAYSPSPVCAPTRCSLLTGLHQGHAAIRNNRELKPEGQEPLPASAVTIAERLKQGGYATAAIGKWGLGPVGSDGDPNKQGFDLFFGHNCQRVAHNHYADHLWRNNQRIDYEGNGPLVVKGNHYTPDLMADEAVTFIRANKEKPFFLYFATPLPHVALQAPDDAVAKYDFPEPRKFPGQGTYVACEKPRATYAAMVTRIDEYVGRIVAELKAQGVADNTLIVFTSDNGPTFNGGTDSEFFNSAMNRRGEKTDVYEGGIRVPLIARWPNKIKPGATSDHITALYDLFPTFLDLAQLPATEKIDGLSILPTLTGQGIQQKHDYLYWEFAPKGFQQALRKDNWKAVRIGLKDNPNTPLELYNLATDPAETTNVAKDHPDIAANLLHLMTTARTPSPIKPWNP